MMKFYNSLTKKKEEFTPINKEFVTMYSCGPTVYNYAHIGNFRSFVFSDVLSRSLKYFGYNLRNVMNLTDVDDKTIRDSKIENLDIKDPKERLLKFTQKYSDFFLQDCVKLNIEKPWRIIKATDSIKEMQVLISLLFEKGFAYVKEDGIYFDVRKNQNYGQLVDIDFSSQEKNSENRVVDDEYDKDNAADFALWKFKKDQDEPSWEIEVNGEFYEGRPGWHIECSAMSYGAFGPSFDIHTGGFDLKFPHHENEIAQSECAHLKKYSNYFMHSDFLLVDSKKMSKSLNNFYRLIDLEEKGYSPVAFRDMCLRSHYRKPLNFTFDSLDAGVINVKKYNDFYIGLKNMVAHDVESSVVLDKYLDAFENALSDDLNTPEALASVHESINYVNRKKGMLSSQDIDVSIGFIDRVDKVLGLLEKDEKIPMEVVELAQKRKLARESKNWEESDKLRDEISSLGYNIKDSKDSKEGYILSKN